MVLRSLRGLILCGGAALASICPHALRAAPTFHALTDAQGRVDVWALRRDLLVVEQLTPTDDGERCGVEGDPNDPPMTDQALAQVQRTEQRCIDRARRAAQRFDAARQAFNRAWGPALRRAMAQGDLVAEVIVRLCETTPLLDRGDEASTCHERLADAAKARLRQIGFEPAYTPCDAKVVSWWRAFRFCRAPSATWQTDSLAVLSLNRRPLTPGDMTWGRELHYGGDAGLYTGLEFREPSAAEQADHERDIERMLRLDPRWAVFLLRRVGRHEWVPVRSDSTSHRLGASWVGQFRLQRGAATWTDALHPMSGMATLRRVGDSVRISIRSGAAPPRADVKDCMLRYSGGLTFLPELTPSGQQAAHRTSLGYFYEGGGWATGTFWKDGQADLALAPLHPHKRYRQVLMQCDEGESDGNERIRFLLLAGDTLLEFAAERPYDNRPLSVRHFRRVR